ncbi:MAG: hypothetical protein AB1730_22795 [Myxococcota bacterium]
MRWWAMAAVALGLSACARCASPAVVDAGAPVPVKAPPKQRARHSVDLRTALLVSYPEYRGSVILEGRAALTRRYVSLPDEAWAKAVKGNGFTPEADGGLVRAPFHVEREGDVVVLWMAVDGPVLEKVFSAPTALSSMDMGLYLPRGLEVADERFELSLRYGAVPHARAAFLSRQVVELLARSGQWKLGAVPEGWGADPGDGGYGEVPERFTVTLEEQGRPATLTVTREASEVRVVYTLVTDAPR